MAALQLSPGVPLNRLRASVNLADYPALNATAANMGTEFVSISLTEDFAMLLPTGTSAVSSENPYVFGTISLSLLKTQPLSSAWVAQSLQSSAIGNVTVYPDSSVFPSYTFINCVITRIEPSAFDGRNPVVSVMMTGTYIVNSNLWASV